MFCYCFCCYHYYYYYCYRLQNDNEEMFSAMGKNDNRVYGKQLVNDEPWAAVSVLLYIVFDVVSKLHYDITYRHF